MDERRLHDLLAAMSRLRVLVIGDFFLDEYLIIEQVLAETSLETGLATHQVVERRCSPGAAGNVAANVSALGASVVALGVIGDDGAGYEITRALRQASVNADDLIVERSRFTPTYTKPLLRHDSGELRELNRFDLKNRMRLPAAVERQVVTRLPGLAAAADAVIIADQTPEDECGVITTRVRDAVCALAAARPALIVAADSRQRIGLYRNVILKPNELEALRAVGREGERPSEEAIIACAEALWRRSGRTVFLTRGAQGIVVFGQAGATRVPAWPVQPPLDIVGAGDTALAALVTALAAGANDHEAATLATLAAAVTIKQIGTTGVATPRQMAALASRR